jgi:hypothetical protein
LRNEGAAIRSWTTGEEEDGEEEDGPGDGRPPPDVPGEEPDDDPCVPGGAGLSGTFGDGFWQLPAEPPLFSRTSGPWMETPAGEMSTLLEPTLSVSCVPASITTLIPPETWTAMSEPTLQAVVAWTWAVPPTLRE